MATQNFSCPQCGSENIQRFSVAFRGGASTIDTKTAGTGVGLSGGHLGIGVGGAHTTGVQMTQLAKEVAPSVKKKYLFPIIASIIVSFLLRVFTESIIGATVSGLLGFIGLRLVFIFLHIKKRIFGIRMFGRNYIINGNIRGFVLNVDINSSCK